MKITAIMVLLQAMVATSTCNISKPALAPSASNVANLEPTGGTMKSPSGTGTTAEMGVVVIQGIFDPAGEKLLELKPVHRYAYSSPPIPNQPTGRFLAKVVLMNRQVTTVPFDALVADDAGRTQYGFFEVTVPVRGDIDYILITDAAGVKTFARIGASEIVP